MTLSAGVPGFGGAAVRGHEGAAVPRARVLIVGLSTRAAGESAACAGFDVTCIDAFADRDQHPGVRALRLGGRFSARAIERMARAIDAAAVAYTSPFENHPAVVQSLANGRPLWGNPPSVLRRTRDPGMLADALRRRGFTVPDARVQSFGTASVVSAGRDWLVKPARSGGGNGIRQWRHGRRVPRGSYLQRFIDGPSWSAAFVASNRGAMTLGLSRQLIGDAAFGADGFRYCGSIVQRASDALSGRVAALVNALSEDFGLAGVNGVDFIRQDDEPVAIEVNPRWSGSMELIERAYGLAMFRVHADACTTGELPPAPACAIAGAHGKAIVFARRTVTMGDTTAWLEDADVRDVPQAGERIVAGRPVCTVFASAADDDGCYAALVTKARAIDEQLAGWGRNVA